MRVITTETKAYKFDELSDEAKDKAIEQFMINDDFPQGQEALDSIKALAAHFGGKMYDWNIDWANSSYSDAKFDMPEDMDPKDIYAKLKALGTFNRRTLRGHGDCALTGVCYDETAIDGFRWAWYREKERDLNVLMQAAFRSWLKAIHEEFDYQHTHEAFRETCEANDYEFTEDGEMV